jgi:predicted ester cyclase
MLTRRGFLNNSLGASSLGAGALMFGAGLTQAPRTASAQANAAQLERNKAVVRRFKELQGTKDEALLDKEVLAPGYKRWRGGFQHLAANAQGQGFPSTGSYLRGSFPDRYDKVEDIAAEGDMVGMLFKLSGTHKGNFYGIEATGKKIDVYEAGVFRLADGKITEAWFMADEAGILKQLGVGLPPRMDGLRVPPPVTGAGEDPDAVLKRLEAGPLDTVQARNKLMVARSKGAAPPADLRAPDFKQRRVGFQHLRDYGSAKGVGTETITVSLPDRRDLIDGFVAEGDTVWMRFKVAGTHAGKLYGLAPTGKRIEVPEIGVMRFADGKWKDAWYFADELGLMLQLNALHMLEA